MKYAFAVIAAGAVVAALCIVLLDGGKKQTADEQPAQAATPAAQPAATPAAAESPEDAALKGFKIN